MTGLRTSVGCDLSGLPREMRVNFEDSNHTFLRKYQKEDLLTLENDFLCLTKKGKLLADEITANLFLV